MSAAALLAALALGVAHSPAQPIDCSYTVSAIADSPPPVMAGNLRTVDGGCLIWVSAPMFLGRNAPYDARDACKTAMHETGHLAGLQHSLDPNDVMYSPYQRVPLPSACRKARN